MASPAHDTGILVDATDRTSFAQAFVPLRDAAKGPTGDDYQLYSVEDRARRVEGLLKHLAKDNEPIKLRTVARPASSLGIPAKPDLIIRVAGSRSLIGCWAAILATRQ